MADKPALSYLPETSQEAVDANQAYREALDRLTASLDQRKNRFFDPRYLAAAQAFLTPAKTGSAFEALGNVAGAVGKAQEDLLKEEQDIAKMQVELSGQGLNMARQKMLMQPYSQFLAGGQGGQPQQEGAPPQQGALPTPAAPQAGGALPNISEEQFMAEGAARGIPYMQRRTEWVDLSKKLQDLRTGGIKVIEGGTYDYGTGAYTPFPSGKTVTMRIFGPGGGKEYENVPESLAARLNQLDASDPQYIKIANQILFGSAAGPAAPSAGAVTPAAGAQAPAGQAPAAQAPSGLSTPSLPASTATPQGRIESASEAASRKAREAAEIELDKERRKTETVEVTKGAGESYNKARTAAEQAGTLFTAAENIIGLVQEQPNAFRTILNQPGIAGAVMRAANEGIATGAAGKISLPAAEIDRAGLNEQQLTTLQLYANQIALAKNANRQMTRVPGEGAVSDFETKLMNAMLEVDYATPQAIQFINELTMMRARHADLRFETFERLRQEGVPLANILTHPDMANVRTGYESALRGLAQRNAQLLKPTRAKETEKIVGKNVPKGQKGKLPPDELERRLDKMLGGR